MKALKLISFDDAIDLEPKLTRTITAQYDDEGIVIYQAYNDEIADYALANNRFGGTFKPERMTWIKPNFLWMMHRSEWANRKNQERILAIKISHDFFNQLLENAVLTSYNNSIYESTAEWKEALESSDVRIQWDPAYNLYDQRQNFKALQLGCKGPVAAQYAQTEIISLIEVTTYAKSLYELVLNNKRDEIRLPEERHYEVPAHLQAQLLIG